MPIGPHCYEHESIKMACSQIPDLVKKVGELIDSLNGEVGKPGWMTKQELRVASLESKMAVMLRVMWGIASAVGLAVLGMILKSAGII